MIVVEDVKMSFWPVTFNGEDGFEELLEQILTQKCCKIAQNLFEDDPSLPMLQTLPYGQKQRWKDHLL